MKSRPNRRQTSQQTARSSDDIHDAWRQVLKDAWAKQAHHAPPAWVIRTDRGNPTDAVMHPQGEPEA